MVAGSGTGMIVFCRLRTTDFRDVPLHNSKSGRDILGTSNIQPKEIQMPVIAWLLGVPLVVVVLLMLLGVF